MYEMFTELSGDVREKDMLAARLAELGAGKLWI